MGSTPLVNLSAFRCPWSLPGTTCRASAVFVGVYEPLKAKLLQMVPENLSVTAHLVSKATVPAPFQ